LYLGAIALGVSLAGDASAIDPLNLLRKREKAAAPAKPPTPGRGPLLGKGPVGKGLPFGKGPALGKGPVPTTNPTAATGPAAPAAGHVAAPINGPAPVGGAATANSPLPGNSAALSKGPGLSKGPLTGRPNPLAGNQGAANQVGARQGATNQLGARQIGGNQLGANQNRPVPSWQRAALSPNAQGRGAARAAPATFRQFQAQHRQAIFAAQSRLPFRPLPGMRGFTGVPPVGETRYVSSEMVFHVGPGVSPQAADAAMRRLGLTTVESQSIGLTGGTLYRLRVADGRQVSDVVRALEAENVGTAQPNYVYTLMQDAAAEQEPDLAGKTQSGDPGQYVVNKLRLAEVHRIAKGKDVLIAVIDSKIDTKHPDLSGTVVAELDAVGRPDQPHTHGTGMTGAIVAQRRLMGIAPGARILAVRAFSPDAKESAQATTRHILAGLEWAIQKGARIINMSFAGPYDPMLALAMKNAREKGIVLIAAAGNAGPTSPPLYPAADPNVIAVTATDENDQLFSGANQGPQIAVAAPGVNILEPSPNNAYQLTTGTSVATAHVSGVAALLIGRNPALDPAAVHEILTASAKNPQADGRDDKYGFGVIDPAQALVDLDARMLEEQKEKAGTPVAAKPAPAGTVAATPVAAKPGAARPAAKPASATTGTIATH
jgi:subtilisin family serine protease